MGVILDNCRFCFVGWGRSINIWVKVSRWGFENLALIITKKFLKYIPYNSGNNSRGIYFSKTLFEGLIFRGAYVRRDVSKSIRLAYSWKEIYRFCFVLLCIWGQFPSTSPLGAYIRRDDFTEGFLCWVWGAYTSRGWFSEFYVYDILFRKTPSILLPSLGQRTKCTPSCFGNCSRAKLSYSNCFCILGVQRNFI